MSIEHYRSALREYRKEGRRDSQASALNNIGMVYRSWGRHPQALQHYQRAMALIDGTENIHLQGILLNNIGMIHQLEGRFTQALDHFQRALALARKEGAKNNIATRTSNLGMALEKLGRRHGALQHYEQALALDRELGRRIDAAIDLNNMGGLLKQLGELERAIAVFTEALNLARASGARPQEAEILRNLGAVRLHQGQFADASHHFQAAIAIFEALRETSREQARRDYLEAKLETYQSLVVSLWREERTVDACDAAERYRARLLGEKLVETGGVMPHRGVEEARQGLTEEEAILLFANADWRAPLLCLVRREGVSMHELDLAGFLDTASASSARETGLSAPPQTGPLPRGLTAVQKPAERLASVRFLDAIHRFRDGLMDPGSDRQRLSALSRLFHGLIIGPVAAEIAGVKKLIVLPDGALSLIPFEALIDGEQRYLAENHRIVYGPSLGVLAALGQRRHADSRRPLLAVGGVRYSRLPDSPAMADSEIYRLARERFKERAPMADLYAALLDVNELADLPGSLREVETIAGGIPGARLVTGAKASEAWIKAQSERGELARYRTVHLATHGLTVPESPQLSALAFANPAGGGEDGFLQLQEVAALRLAADFVNLSACETGLGRLYGGEGVVGLSQAFLVAGANALSATLWPVADVATERFMADFYRLAGAGKRSLSESLAVENGVLFRGRSA